MAAGSDSVGDFGFLFKYLGSYMSDTVCPTSSDNKHHGEVTGISGASRGGFYTAVCLCDYCGKAFEASCTSSDFDTAYNSYVSGLQSDLGTTTLLNGGYRHYFPLWSCGLGGTNSSFPYNLDVVEKSSPFLVSGSRDIDTTIAWLSMHFGWDGGSDKSALFVAPCEGLGKFGYFFSINNLTFDSGWINATDFYVYPAGYTCNGLYIPHIYNVVSGNFSLSGSVWFDFYPTNGLPDATTQNITINSRPTTIIGTYIGGDGTIYKNCTIVDETNNTILNPVTGTTTTFTSWAYDYATRTYTLYDADGNIVTVAYQDQQVVINEGDTTTNIYYGSSDSGSGGSGSGGTLDPGTSGSGSSLLDKIKDGIVGALQALIEGVFALIKTILEKLLGLAKDLLSFVFDFLTDTVLGGIKNLFSAFGDSGGLFDGFKSAEGGYQLPENDGVTGAFAFISGCIGILPEPMRYIFLFGLGAIFFFAILKKVGE